MGNTTKGLESPGKWKTTSDVLSVLHSFLHKSSLIGCCFLHVH